MENFSDIYERGKIFIPKETAEKLDEIRSSVSRALMEIRLKVDIPMQESRSKNPDWAMLEEMEHKLKTISKLALSELEYEFRLLLGSDLQQG